MKEHENPIFLGPPGIGKTHLAVSICLQAISQGYKTYFVSAHDLIIQLRKADSDGKLEKKLRSFVKPRLLIIDEMGYMKLDIGDADYLNRLLLSSANAPVCGRSNLNDTITRQTELD
ncbi:ATP-binding protein [Fictibacillus enclensis]|uniref:ATP-binding protein n=1 Tax=Fictibacillus enclensis TaxID=1017270 RepID=UPI0025A1643B|nr:ATP-binding protein [Fictibacillus enclensis]MDM5338169.1 ATP-binding protein [Fictibacillus enclensis]